MSFIRNHKRGIRAGFTLVETLVATVIIVLFSSAILPLFTVSNRSVMTAHNREIATQAGHEILEQLRRLGYAQLPAIPAGETSVMATFEPPASLPRATGTLKFSRVDSSFAATLTETHQRKVEATITWQGSRSDRGKVVQATLIVKE